MDSRVFLVLEDGMTHDEVNREIHYAKIGGARHSQLRIPVGQVLIVPVRWPTGDPRRPFEWRDSARAMQPGDTLFGIPVE